MDVINKEIIQNANPVQLGDAMQKSPGVIVQDGQISIRGGSSYSYGVGTRTAVLVDNMNFVSGDLGDAQLKFAPLEATEQVEVIKGSSSVVYGSSALNGVVNLRTSWGQEKPATEFSMFATVFGAPARKELAWWGRAQPIEMGASFLHKHKKKIVNYVVGGNYYHLNSHLEKANERRGRGFFKTKFNLPKVAGLTFGINGNIMYETSDRFFLSQDLDVNQFRFSTGSDDRYLRTSIDPHLQVLLPRNNKFQFNARLLNVYRFGNGDDLDANSWVYAFDIQHQKWFTFKNESNLILTAGLPFTVSTNKSNLWPDQGTLVTAFAAAYIQLEYKYKRLTLLGGGRYEIQKIVQNLEKSKPIFRAGVNYNAGKATFLRVSWGQGYRLPSLAERYIAENLVGPTFVIPTRELKPEASWNFEIGVKQGFRIGKNWKGVFDFSVYTMNFTDLVEYTLGFYPNLDEEGKPYFADQGPFVLGFKPFNIDVARIGGYEASVLGQGKMGEVSLNILGGYTYNYPANASGESENRNWGTYFKNAVTSAFRRLPLDEIQYINSEGKEAYNILQYRNRHMVRADVEANYKKFMLGYALYYNSFAELVPPTFRLVFNTLDGGALTMDKWIAKHEKGDWVMDIRAGYKPTDKLSLLFIVKNFTNHEYSNRVGRADAPINFTLKARYVF